MTPKYVVPKGTILALKTKHKLGLDYIHHTFNAQFAKGEVKLKDCEILDQNSITGVFIVVNDWSTQDITVTITKATGSGNMAYPQGHKTPWGI